MLRRLINWIYRESGLRGLVNGLRMERDLRNAIAAGKFPGVKPVLPIPEPPPQAQTLLIIRVAQVGESLTTEIKPTRAMELGALAEVYANVRVAIRRSVAQIEKDMDCGGVFALEVLKDCNRLIKEGPEQERTITQEVPSDE